MPDKLSVYMTEKLAEYLLGVKSELPTCLQCGVLMMTEEGIDAVPDSDDSPGEVCSEDCQELYQQNRYHCDRCDFADGSELECYHHYIQTANEPLGRHQIFTDIVGPKGSYNPLTDPEVFNS